MKIPFRVLSFCAGLSLPIASFGQAFNFLYHLEGERPQLHASVFDDGQKTYLQYRGPLTFELFTRSKEDPKEVALEWHFEAPYLIINQVLNCIYLRANGQVLGIFKDTSSLDPCVHSPVVPDPPATPAQESAPARTEKRQRVEGEAPPEARPVMLSIQKGDRLSNALRQFLLSQGYLLNWNSPDDFMIREAYVSYGNSVEDIMRTLERDYRLKIQLNLNRFTVLAPSARQ